MTKLLLILTILFSSALYAQPDPCLFEPAVAESSFKVEYEEGSRHFNVKVQKMIHDACTEAPKRFLSFKAVPKDSIPSDFKAEATIVYIDENGLPEFTNRSLSLAGHHSIGVPFQAQKSLLQGRDIRIVISYRAPFGDTTTDNPYGLKVTKVIIRGN